MPFTAVQTETFVQIGNRRFPLTSYAEASAALRHMLDETGATFSGETGPKAPQPLIVDATGKRIGYISQNGKVWSGNPREWESSVLLYSPYANAQVAS